LTIGLVSVIFSFINEKKKNEIKKAGQQKEIIQLEIEKEKIVLKRLEEENKKYDEEIKIIENNNDKPTG
jgi:hypothetical protein